MISAPNSPAAPGAGTHRPRRQGDLWRAARHPDAGGALSAHSRRHGQWRDLAVSGALPGRLRRAARTRSCCRAPTGCCRISSRPRRSWSRLGAEAITTNCGFLSLFQRELAAAVARAGRDLVADAGALGAGDAAAGQARRHRHGVGAPSLTPAHLAAAGVPLDTPIAGTENGHEFFRVLIKAEKDDMDVELAEQDVVAAALRSRGAPSRCRRDRARMHQHAALCGGRAGGDRAAGLRHLFA